MRSSSDRVWLRPLHNLAATIRRTGVRPICTRRAISDLLMPARCSFQISAACAAAVAGRPNPFPFCRACARPALVHSRRTSLSNSAGMASRPAIAPPAGMVRSSASVRIRTPRQDAPVPGALPSDPLPTGPSGPVAITVLHRSLGGGRPPAVSRELRLAAPEPTSRALTTIVQPRRAVYSRTARLCIDCVWWSRVETGA